MRTIAEARVRELEAALETATRMSSEDLAGVQAANSDLRKRIERLTHQLADETGARDLRIRELEAAAREADTDYQRVVEERDRAEARLGQMAARPVVDAGTRKALQECVLPILARLVWGVAPEMTLVEATRAALKGE